MTTALAHPMTAGCVASGSIPLLSRCRGFLLVELLIGLGLGLILIAAVTTTTQQLWGVAFRAADQSELAERGDYGARLLATAVGRAWPIVGGAGTASPCQNPTPRNSRGLWVLEPGQFSCLPQNNLAPGAKLLVLDELQGCPDGYCKGQRLPGWRFEQPGCDPLFMDVPSRITLHTRLLRDADCAGATRLSAWVRRVWYLRDYSVHPGDGSGALMVKTWRDSQQGFGRGEVLVPGVTHWDLQVVSVPERDALPSKSTDGGHVAIWDQSAAVGLDFSLTLKGWVKDPVMTSMLNPDMQSQLPAALLQWSPESLPILMFSSLAVSTYLTQGPSWDPAE